MSFTASRDVSQRRNQSFVAAVQETREYSMIREL